MNPQSTAGRCVVAAVVLFSAGPPVARAEDRTSELESLRKELRRLERRIEDLESRSAPESSDAAALDAALEEIEKAETKPKRSQVEPSTPGLASTSLGPLRARLLDLSLDVLAAIGGSTEDDESLELLQAGGHDPRKNGFTLQNVELSATGAVDPYLTGEAHFIFFLDADGETVVELEEAFFQTLALPWGLELEGGHFFTEFGRLNPRHPHAWFWQDQPIVNSRLLGPDGMRNPGVRLGALLPLPWFSELHAGVQNPTGETMPSFLGGSLEHGHGEEEEPGEDGEEHVHEFERGIAGRPIVDQTVRDPRDMVWLARWVNAFDLTDEISTQIGGSFATGRNTTGENARTRLYGADLVLKVRPAPSFRGWPFFVFESEFLARDFEADGFRDPDDPVLLLPAETLHDYGVYAQGVVGFAYGWATGVRFEYVTGDGESVGGRSNDPFRDDRFRLSPLLLWQPTEFSRFRLQYNVDDADHLDGPAHAVWLGAEFLYGAHPAHAY